MIGIAIGIWKDTYILYVLRKCTASHGASRAAACPVAC